MPKFHTNHPGCNQSYSTLLDTCQMIYQKFLHDLVSKCPGICLQLCIDEALQIAFVEIHKLETQGERVYPILLNRLQDPMLREIENLGETPPWRNIITDSSEIELLSGMQHRLLFFFFRVLSLILFMLKVEVSRETKHELASNLLVVISEATKFLRHGNRTCSLKDIFSHCRKNALSHRDICDCIIKKQDDTLTNVIGNIDSFAEKKSSFTSQKQEKTLTISQTRILRELQKLSKSQVLTEKQIQAQTQILTQALGESSITHAGFSGDLTQISVWQVLQVLGMEKSSGCLKIKNTLASAKVFLNEGIVTHCEIGEEQGEEAFYQLINFDSGQFAFMAKTIPPVTTMNHTIEGLLLQIAQRMEN